MVVELRDQIDLGFRWPNSRWIRQGVQRSTNHHQAQQTNRNSGFHGVAGLSNPEGRPLAPKHPVHKLLPGHASFD
jgi:hypothetical protein